MRILILAATLALSGCGITHYQLAVMPRDSGKVYSGVAEETGYGEGRISVTIEERTYNGTWVQATPEYTSGYVTGGYGWGGRRGGWGGWGLGGTVTMDNPQGAASKALLSSADGQGLRCDFTSGQGRGGGVCRDDRGREYDVQLRPAPRG